MRPLQDLENELVVYTGNAIEQRRNGDTWDLLLKSVEIRPLRPEPLIKIAPRAIDHLWIRTKPSRISLNARELYLKLEGCARVGQYVRSEASGGGVDYGVTSTRALSLDNILRKMRERSACLEERITDLEELLQHIDKGTPYYSWSSDPVWMVQAVREAHEGHLRNLAATLKASGNAPKNGKCTGLGLRLPRHRTRQTSGFA